MKFYEWYEKWFRLYRFPRISVASQRIYFTNLRILENSTLGNLPLSKVTRATIQQHVSSYGKNVAKKTITDHAKTIDSALEDAVVDGLIPFNPYMRITISSKENSFSPDDWKKQREEKKWLEEAEFLNLKEFLEEQLDRDLNIEPYLTIQTNRTSSKPSSQTELMVLLLQVKTGARFSEILGLKPSDIGFADSTLTIERTWDYKFTHEFGNTKNPASVRTILLDSDTADLLSQYLEWSSKYGVVKKEDSLFIEYGKVYHNFNFNETLRNILDGLEIEYVSMHKLRHSHASYLLAKGIPIEVISKRLGHRDTNMVRTTYGHLFDSVYAEESQKIIALL